MKKHLFSFLFLLAFVFSISAQKAQTAKPDVTLQNLQKHVSYLSSDKLEGRRTGEKGATFASGYVANQFASFKLKAGFKPANGKANYLQPFPYSPRNERGGIIPNATPVEAYNVIGILEGTDPVLKNEAIVIGAHYDHLGKGGMGSLAVNSTEIHHGADDNASGTSALIELARQFSKAKNNKRTIIFIAFGGEEEGLLGSKFYVNNPVFPLDKTVAMINLDMVGRLKDDKLTVGGIGTASEWKDLVTLANTKYEIESSLLKKGICCVNANISNGQITLEGTTEREKLPDAVKVSIEIAKQKVINHLTLSDGNNYKRIPSIINNSFTLQLNEDGFGPSDHASFYLKQIPVLFFFTGTHLDYHKPSDTFDKINYDGLRKITEYVRQIAEYVDQYMNKRPTYTVAKSSATETGRRGFSVSLGTIPSYSEGTDGMVIDGVRDDSPASKAGLKANDKIIKLAGKDIRNVQDYTAVLGDLKPDVEYEIVVMRGAEKLTLKIVPVARK